MKYGVGKLAIVGAGPAGLMAAETARAAGVEVDIYESKGSVGRKFLLAGKGGLNLTHSEAPADFVRRYGAAQAHVGRWLNQFDANALRDWARGLGAETFVGTSGRVFPSDLKAAPLLRKWVRRLRDQGVRFHVHHECKELRVDRTLRFQTPDGKVLAHADAVVLAMGGASWPELGSNGEWIEWLQPHAVEIAPLAPSNCGFEIRWSEIFSKRYAGQPVKSVLISATDEQGVRRQLQGEFVVSSYGVEGSAIYALSADLRRVIDATGSVEIELDLLPGRDITAVEQALSPPRNGKTLTEHLRRRVGIDGVKMGLLYEVMEREAMNDVHQLAIAIKALKLKLVKPRPVAEAISSAGGVRFASMNQDLMLDTLPGVFCAGEMIDWEAPTGGYLLTACFASGRVAAEAAVRWLERLHNS